MIYKISFFFILIFSWFTVYGQPWTQIGQDIEGHAESDKLGYSVSLNSDGSVIAVGAPADAFHLGYVKILQNINGTWTQIGENIYGTDDGDEFGHSISLNSDGSIVAIGASSNMYGIIPYAGYVRIFENINGTWTQIGEDINGESAHDGSGSSISLNSDGTIIAIGAGGNDGNGNYSGHVRVFENNNGTWEQKGQDIDGEAPEDSFGFKVSINSDGKIVSASGPGNDDNGKNSGHVRVFKNINNKWEQIGQDIDGEYIDDHSGISLSLNSNGLIVAIGSETNDGAWYNSGHVRVYQYIDETWNQIGTDIEGLYDEHMGISVSLNSKGSIVAMGSYFCCVRVYENISGNWIQIGSDIEPEYSGTFFGFSLSLNFDGFHVASGAYRNPGNGNMAAGQARVFNFNPVNVADQNMNKISIYPNPAQDIIHFEFQDNSIKNIIVFGISGKKLFEKRCNSKTEKINITGFNKGLYFVSVYNGKNIYTERFIKL